MTKRITIDPITRLEGHGKIEIFLDDAGDVGHTYFQVPELRGFEQFCLGRKAEDMPNITNRICGVCPEAHHMASTKALDAVFGVEPTPAAKKIRELCESITERTSRQFLLLDPETLVERLNRQLHGWANYFRRGASNAVRLVDRHVTTRFRRWLCRKHKVPGRGYQRFPDAYLTEQLGLVRLPQLRRNLPCAKA